MVDRFIREATQPTSGISWLPTFPEGNIWLIVAPSRRFPAYGISAFLQSRVQVGYLRKSAEAARGALRIGTEQYEQGATDFTTVLTAEQNLFQAESSVATALANVALGATAIYRALGGGWQVREDSYFVTAATSDQMRARTNWGELLPPAGAPQPPAPGLPSPADIGPTVRPPEW